MIEHSRVSIDMEPAGAAAVMAESCLNPLEDIQRRHRSEIRRLRLMSNSGNFSDMIRKRSRSRNGHFCSVCLGEEVEGVAVESAESLNAAELQVSARGDFYPARRLIRSVSTPIGFKGSLFCSCAVDKLWEAVNRKSKPLASEKSNLNASKAAGSDAKQGVIIALQTEIMEVVAESKANAMTSNGDTKDSAVSAGSEGSPSSAITPLPHVGKNSSISEGVSFLPSSSSSSSSSSSQKMEKVTPKQNERSSRRTKGICRANSESIGMLLGDPCPPHGTMSHIGRRREMEDAVAAVPSFYSLPKATSSSPTSEALHSGLSAAALSNALHFFAVYDGHGGPQASIFCKDRFHELLAEELRNEPLFSRERNDWSKVMSACFKKMDIAVGGMCPNDVCIPGDSKQTGDCCHDPVAPENVGSTAVVAVVSVTQIVVANCGDSRAVLSRGGKAIPLSRDHKPDREDEMNRIDAAGGRVIHWNGYRVGGFLAMSRALGDRFLKRYVISEPEVTCTERTHEDECLILASDGLWDVLSNEIVCEVARKCLAGYRPHRSKGIMGDTPVGAAAALLTKLALGKGSGDNISVVVVDLKERRRSR